jgi:hypothetical protein
MSFILKSKPSITMKLKPYLYAVLLLGIVFVISCKKSEPVSKMMTDCLPSNLQNGVLAYYPFSAGSLNDFSGNNHNLINNTTAASGPDRAGNPNCAFLFTHNNNLDEFLVQSNPVFLNGLNEFSVSLWYMPLETSIMGYTLEGLVCRGLGTHCPDRMGQWSLGLSDCRGAVFGRTNSVWERSVTGGHDCKEEVTAKTNNWYHAVATFRQRGMQMAIYRNGVLQAVSSGDINCGAGTPPVQDIGDLFLGKNYNGLIDDVIIYNRTLSATEIAQLYQVAPCCQN